MGAPVSGGGEAAVKDPLPYQHTQLPARRVGLGAGPPGRRRLVADIQVAASIRSANCTIVPMKNSKSVYIENYLIQNTRIFLFWKFK